MHNNRIRELRLAKGWSMRELAARLNASASTINDLEKGTTRLNTDWMRRLAKAFEVPPATFMDFSTDKLSGLSEDAAPYEGEAEVNLQENEFPYIVKTNALDQIGILEGGIAIVSIAKDKLAKLETRDAVIVQKYEGMSAKTLLRQFIEPSLLITNSSGENAPIINMRRDDAVIKGVVTAFHTRFRHRG